MKKVQRLAQPPDLREKSNMRLSSCLFAVALIGALSACAGGLPPGGIAALDGFYEGEMTRSAGPPMNCPAAYTLRMTVARGEVRGEVFDPRQPDVPADRFSAFVEADGRVVNSLRVGGLTFGVRGRFGARSFVGTADGQVCGLSINAARRP
jgi:hypothetical protein